MQSPQAAPAGARCAVHTEAAASAVCGRCGNFMCGACSQGGAQAWCPACVSAYAGAFPFKRDDFDFSRIWDFCWAIFTREWVMLSVAVIIYFFVAMAGGMVGNIFTQAAMQATIGADPSVLSRNPEKLLNARNIGILGSAYFASILIQSVVTGIGLMGLIRVSTDLLHGRKLELGRMFLDIRKLGRYVGAQLVLMAVGLVALVPMGIVAAVAMGASRGDRPLILGGGLLVTALLGLTLGIIALPLVLVQYEIVYGDAGTIESLSRVWRLGSGYRLQIFGYSLIGGLIAIAGMIACCVGLLPAMGLQQLILASLFLALRNGSDLPKAPEA